MGFNCGIIGLPNVGKSTIFNALSGAGAQMANYPFCTIEPNRAIVPVPDDRLNKISDLIKKENPIPTRIEFIDVAGLVKGASRGEGLGNKFLGHIREVDAVIHVVRCFSNEDVVHVTGDIDPVRDIQIINTELMIADIELLEKAKEKVIKLERSGDKDAALLAGIIEKGIEHLNGGKQIRSLKLHDEESLVFNQYGLITDKPVLYLANTGEEKNSSEVLKQIADYASDEGSEHLYLVGKLEEEIAEFPEDEKAEYLEVMGLKKSGLERLILAGYNLLDLISYYTAATDLQAWTLKRGTNTKKAAGKIHTDFEKGFIRAEVYTFDDLIDAGSEQTVKEKGMLRAEGKDYIVKDGDIIKYLFN